MYTKEIAFLFIAFQAFSTIFGSPATRENNIARLKRDESSDHVPGNSEEIEKNSFLDFLIETYLQRIVRRLTKENYIRKKSATSDIAQIIFEKFVKSHDLYKILKEEEPDSFSAISTFNTPKWWTELTYKISSESKDSVSLIDLFFETILFDIFKWICNSKIVYSKKTVHEITEFLMKCLKDENFYKIITGELKEGKKILKLLENSNWWLTKGNVITNSDGTKQWKFS